MKYCRSCKTRADDSATVCSKCGKPLSMLGGASPAAPPPLPVTPPVSPPTLPDAVRTAGSPQPTAKPTFSAAASTAPPPLPPPQQPSPPVATPLTLEGQIGELEAAKTRNVRRGRILALLCGAVLCAFCITFYEIYSYAVLSYAVLENVQIEQDPNVDNTVRVSFNVVRPGKVAFDRKSGVNRTEKLDLFQNTGEERFAWTWPSDTETGIDFRVVFRKWVTCTEVQKHFNVTGKGKSQAVDIVFLMDTTTSMTPFIEGLKRKCIEFANVVRESGIDCQLGLIGFGDVDEGEPIELHQPTGELQRFQTWVEKIARTNGGDFPESSVEALEKALSLQYRGNATVCFVHITDDACHHQERMGHLADRLKERHVITYIVSRNKFANLYLPLCLNGGDFYGIEDAQFADILLKVARSISSQMSYR